MTPLGLFVELDELRRQMIWLNGGWSGALLAAIVLFFGDGELIIIVPKHVIYIVICNHTVCPKIVIKTRYNFS